MVTMSDNARRNRYVGSRGGSANEDVSLDGSNIAFDRVCQIIYDLIKKLEGDQVKCMHGGKNAPVSKIMMFRWDMLE